jgi:hypothetical protein
MTPTVKTRKREVEKNWVIVKLQNGAVQAWRDYGMAWGSPVYTVLGYATNCSQRDAILKGTQAKGDG